MTEHIWKRARKKAVVVEFREVAGEVEIIHTLEGDLEAHRGKSLIVRGVKGECYPVDKGIFAKTYDVLSKDKESPYRRQESTKNIVQFDQYGKPSCEEHGAMNCVSKSRQMWRCLMCGIGVSFGSIEAFDEWVELHKKRLKAE